MEPLDKRVYELEFGIHRSIRYHTRRRAFFDRCSTTSDALAVIFSSATIFSLLNEISASLAPLFAAVVTITTAINLVVGSSRMARLHHDLARRFIALEIDMSSVGEPTEDEYRRWISHRLSIEADEPPVLRVLDTICHNDVIQSMGIDPAYMIPLAGWQRRLAQFFDLSDHDIRQPNVPSE